MQPYDVGNSQDTQTPPPLVNTLKTINNWYPGQAEVTTHPRRPISGSSASWILESVIDDCNLYPRSIEGRTSDVAIPTYGSKTPGALFARLGANTQNTIEDHIWGTELYPIKSWLDWSTTYHHSYVWTGKFICDNNGFTNVKSFKKIASRCSAWAFYLSWLKPRQKWISGNNFCTCPARSSLHVTGG